MSSVQQQLSSLQQQATALQQSLAAVAVAADQNLHASKLVPLSGSPQSKPAKGMSKSKKAALILDAMKPLLSTALEQVRGCPCIWFSHLSWHRCALACCTDASHSHCHA